MPSIGALVWGFLVAELVASFPTNTHLGTVHSPSKIPLRKRDIAKKTLQRPADDQRIPAHVYKATGLPKRDAPLKRNLEDLGPIAKGRGKVAQDFAQTSYNMDVEMGGKKYTLIVDTGSADTWVSKEGFRCYDSSRQPTTQEYCLLGPNFMREFPDGEIRDMVFAIEYGYSGGPFINGTYGYTDMKIAGLDVNKVPIALTTAGYFNGDEIVNGILGLGLPFLTASYELDGQTYKEYDPLVATMAKEGIAPVFALALSRDINKSFITFGGVPDVEVEPEVAVAPIIKRAFSFASEYFYYEMNLGDFIIGPANGSQSITLRDHPSAIVDSGTTLNLLSSDAAVEINAAFDPPAEYWPNEQLFVVKCNAKPPSLAITVGGVPLATSPESFILPQLTDGEYCASTMMAQLNEGSPYVLGDPFMQDLVSVFDVAEDKMEMRFSRRK